jgi:DNA-binding response OmpR family regulator
VWPLDDVRILVVEDDPKISRFLLKGLREENHVVDLAEDGEAADERGQVEMYDVILLDVLLPGCDGFEVCRRLRAAGVDTPILMLTARDAVQDRIRGLDAGADDYLPKPFAFDELLARIRALTRRGRTHALTSVVSVGSLAVDTEARVSTVNGEPLSLTATEYRLLEHLARHAGQVVSREQLAEHVWGAEYDPFSNLADVYVGYLRRKLDLEGNPPRIQTVRGLGYMLKEGDGT